MKKMSARPANPVHLRSFWWRRSRPAHHCWLTFNLATVVDGFSKCIACFVELAAQGYSLQTFLGRNTVHQKKTMTDSDMHLGLSVQPSCLQQHLALNAWLRLNCSIFFLPRQKYRKMLTGSAKKESHVPRNYVAKHDKRCRHVVNRCQQILWWNVLFLRRCDGNPTHRWATQSSRCLMLSSAANRRPLLESQFVLACLSKFR